MTERPSLEALLPHIARLNASMETLAAVAVHLAPDGPRPHPALAETIATVARLAGVPEGLAAEERAVGVAFVRAFFRQAADLLERPDREPGWTFDDPAVLQSQGRASALLARILRGLPDDSALRRALDRPGARFLDVGTGVGWLAIGMARAFPALEVVGIDREERVLSLARENVRATDLETRIELRLADAAAMEDPRPFDAVWLPGPFLDGATFQRVAEHSRALLAPGGCVVVGTYGDEDPLAAALADLRTLRSGGTPWKIEPLAEALAQAGLEGAAEVPKTWPAPIRLVVASKRAGR